MLVSHKAELAQLWSAIHECRRCADLLDPAKAARNPAAAPPRARLMLVSQALADETQRRSGVPFFRPDGTLGRTGVRLEPVLNRIGFTLAPPQPVVTSGAEIPAAVGGLETVYATEIIQCFPGGAKGGGHQSPAKAARRCLSAGYLAAEIGMVNPLLILVMGSWTWNQFWRHFAGQPAPTSVRECVASVAGGGAPSSVLIAGERRAVVGIPHASPVNTSFPNTVGRNDSFLRALTRIVEEA